MDTIKIKVRKEVVRCDKCKKAKAFLYLSDFSYGQRLIFLNNGKEYAFVNLIEDNFFAKYTETVENLLKENGVKYTSKIVNDFVDKTYGITCDKINGNIVDLSIDQKKCFYCGSTEFERNMIEPETLIEIEVSLISHNKWERLSKNEQKKLIENKLKEKGIF